MKQGHRVTKSQGHRPACRRQGHKVTVKIIGGKFKGRNFYMPAGVRPTKGLMRKVIFDLLGNDLSNLDVLDLFAGSGAVGLEAISRGARKVVFVEKMPRYIEIIKENIEHLGLDKEGEARCPYELANADTFMMIKSLARQGKKFDIVFFDPPYNRGLGKKTLKTLSAYDIVNPNCYIIAEYGASEHLPAVEGRFSLVREKKYGKTFLNIYKSH